MKTVSLKEYALEHGQAATGKALGVNQSAISQMLSANRNIKLTIHADGSVTAVEIKSIGRKAAA